MRMLLLMIASPLWGSQLFTITDMQITQTNGDMPDVSRQDYLWGEMVSMFHFSAQNWSLGPGQSLTLDWSFHASAPVSFTAELMRLNYYGSGNTAYTFSSQSGNVALHVQVDGMDGTEVLQGASIGLLVDVPEPVTWLTGLPGVLFPLLRSKIRRPMNAILGSRACSAPPWAG